MEGSRRRGDLCLLCSGKGVGGYLWEEVEVYLIYGDMCIRRFVDRLCLIDSNRFSNEFRGGDRRSSWYIWRKIPRAVRVLRTVCDTSREEIRILIRVESKNRVESNELARVRPRDDRLITVIAIVPIESSRVKNFKRKRKKKRRGRRKERRNRAKSKKGANNGSGVSLRGNRRRVLGGAKNGAAGTD